MSVVSISSHGEFAALIVSNERADLECYIPDCVHVVTRNLRTQFLSQFAFTLPRYSNYMIWCRKIIEFTLKLAINQKD